MPLNVAVVVHDAVHSISLMESSDATRIPFLVTRPIELHTPTISGPKVVPSCAAGGNLAEVQVEAERDDTGLPGGDANGFLFGRCERRVGSLSSSSRLISEVVSSSRGRFLLLRLLVAFDAAATAGATAALHIADPARVCCLFVLPAATAAEMARAGALEQDWRAATDGFARVPPSP